MSDYPEHDKLKSKDDAGAHSAICEFLDFLEEKGWSICSLEQLTREGLSGQEVKMAPAWYPIMVQPRSIVAQFFGIDEREWEKEKDAMLEACRARNVAREE